MRDCIFQPRFQHVNCLSVLIYDVKGASHAQSLRDISQFLPSLAYHIRHEAFEHPIMGFQALNYLFHIRNDDFSSLRRRCSTLISNEICDCAVYLMTDSGYHRYLRCIYGSRNHLLVERPQLLKRATSPADNENINANVNAVHKLYCIRYLNMCSVPLNHDGHHKHMHMRISPPQNVQHVPYCSACRRCYDAYTLRKLRYRLLSRFVKKPLGM